MHWANIIDGAQYSDPKTAVELGAPAMKLTLVIEGSKGSDMVQQIIGLMQRMPLAEIMEQPEVQEIYKPLYERHLKSLKIIREKADETGGVITFDLTGDDLEGYNKFIPYYLYPEGVYTVAVSPSSFRTKISVGSNPWAPVEPRIIWPPSASATAAAGMRAWAPSAWSRARWMKRAGSRRKSPRNCGPRCLSFPLRTCGTGPQRCWSRPGSGRNTPTW